MRFLIFTNFLSLLLVIGLSDLYSDTIDTTHKLYKQIVKNAYVAGCVSTNIDLFETCKQRAEDYKKAVFSEK